MKLLLKDEESSERLAFIRKRLAADWELLPVHAAHGQGAFSQALRRADALISMSFDRSLGEAPALSLLQIPGAGFDRVDFAALPPGCAVCNVFEHEIPIAEYLLLAMLEWLIRAGRMSEGLHAGRWNDGVSIGEPVHGELYGKTVGFIGYGHIARETAKRLEPFGVSVIACTRSPHKGGEFVQRISGMESLDALLEVADFVVVTCPLTAATRGLIDAARIARMRPSAVLINVARAAVVDEAALFAACKSHRIAGAVIDVWTHYPRHREAVTFPSDHPFHELDNVVMTPHASGWSDGLWDRRWRAMCDNLNRLAGGDALANVLREPGGAPPG